MSAATGTMTPFSHRLLHLASASPFRRKGGQAMGIAAVFFLAILLTVVLGAVSPVLNQVEASRAMLRSTASFYGAEGVLEDVAYRLIKGKKVDAVEVLDFGAFAATATTTDTADGKTATASGGLDSFIRTTRVALVAGTSAEFLHSAQAGEGGIVLEDSSSVAGSAFANGSVRGTDLNPVGGEVVSAGPEGLADNVHATGTIYANTIREARTDKDAHYSTIINTTVLGKLYPGSADRATTSLPISDDLIEAWKSGAAAGGEITSPCPYTIEEDATIGPVKIACDLEITGGPTVTVAGAVWVAGNILIKNTARVNVAPSEIGKSVPIIADDSSNRSSGSRVSLENSAAFGGAGEGSYVFFVSANNSAENGGSETAVEARNTVTGDFLLYAGHGEVLLRNSVTSKGTAAYRIRLKNSATARYGSGLAHLLFTSGPGGGVLTRDTWREVE